MEAYCKVLAMTEPSLRMRVEMSKTAKQSKYKGICFLRVSTKKLPGKTLSMIIRFICCSHTHTHKKLYFFRISMRKYAF